MKNPLLIISIVLSIAIYIPLSLKTAEVAKHSKGSPLTLQFAITAKNGKMIVDSWSNNPKFPNDELKKIALQSLYIDFGWLIAYTMLFISLGLPLKKTMLIAIPIIAGSLDTIENIIHIIIINQQLFNLVPVASIVAITKFGLLAINVALLIIFAIRRRRQPNA